MDFINKLRDSLKGYKTYLTVAIAFIIGGLNATGHLDSATTEKIYGILAFLGLGFLRSAVTSENAKK